MSKCALNVMNNWWTKSLCLNQSWASAKHSCSSAVVLFRGWSRAGLGRKMQFREILRSAVRAQFYSSDETAAAAVRSFAVSSEPRHQE